MREPAEIEKFIADWRDAGGSELANTQSFINGLCRILGVDVPPARERLQARAASAFRKKRSEAAAIKEPVAITIATACKP